MKKNLTGFIILIIAIPLLACGGKGKETPASIAQKWCELNSKVHKASSDEEKDKAKDVRKNYEKEMEAKYQKDQVFMDEIKKEVEKCEDASEGK